MSQTSLPRLDGCSSSDLYTLTTKLGEGTFGQVWKGEFKPTGTAVAMKEIIVHERDEGIPITALRELKIMKALRNDNILHLLDMAVKKGDRDKHTLSSFYMVTAYMDHDLCGLLHNKEVRFTLPLIKLYMSQMLSGIAYLHEQKYMHRDMKSANVLVSNNGNIKVADFGLARKYFEAPPDLISATPASHKYTPKVVTRWYRPPELLLGEQYYTTAIDIWGVGCIFGEFFKRKVILPGNSDTDQIHRIFQLLGSPTEETLPNFLQFPVAREIMPLPDMPRTFDDVFHNVPVEARELMAGLLDLNPQRRLTAIGALQHRFFTEGKPPAAPEDVPAFPTSRELDVRRKREAPSPPQQQRVGKVPRRYELRPGPRAFAPKIPYKHVLSAAEQIPPYRRSLDGKKAQASSSSASRRRLPRTSDVPETKELENTQAASVMSNGLDY